MSELDDFRARVREFLATHADRAGTASHDDGDAVVARGKAFQNALADAGLAALTYPVEVGGAGLDAEHQKVFDEESNGYEMPSRQFMVGIGICAPTLLEHGTDEQRRTYLPALLRADAVWCQLFSEPGAGSDVASLQTRAERDGDEWVVNGQKVWTSGAHYADYGLLVARTNRDVPKHRGISMFICDMHAPGVTSLPLRQIDGRAHFNEVFFTDVRIPKDWQIGELNAGWKLATAMLMYERVAIGGAGAGKINQPQFKQLLKAAKETGQIDNPVVRDQLMQIWSMETTKALVAMKNRDEQKAGKTPGPGGSLGKLFGSVIAWKVRAMMLEFAGPGSVAWDPSDETGGERVKMVLNSFQSGIAGGTDEIQRNIIGDRVHGLPREPAVDRDVAFKDLKVGTQKA